MQEQGTERAFTQDSDAALHGDPQARKEEVCAGYSMFTSHDNTASNERKDVSTDLHRNVRLVHFESRTRRNELWPTRR
jgi:hypothetical protein